MQHTVLLVEDDISISEMVQEYLVREGYKVIPAYDGEAAASLFQSQAFDLVLLDLMLPKINGMDVLQIMRGKSLVPVLIMSAKDSDVDKALGLGFGADDYITKPFSMIELAARVKAAIRRANYVLANATDPVKPDSLCLTIGDLRLDVDNFSVQKRGIDIRLTAKEFQILKLFVSHPGRVFTKAQVYGFIWNDEYYGDENVINVHMRRLREKIEDDPSHPKYIVTLWGIGYKLGDCS
ncbi:DNA-binding response OmpR family regulator [Paenibacillus shirakamiensis]|uniref:DNA-binding response OmpR family regulator n=1 Tax=Paenibacillus shirakamiensis TaxID=1265935 RepID=A0ABS4JIZ3_9BACL|nr:response regulator transcription factor [Paenibacillus shirakamiensis]MBP2001665.1 DNA-binding response OmpR family regulator [Paenibacillus shirakamiensis]